MADLRPTRTFSLGKVKARNSIRYDAEPIIDEAAVASAIEWADRILAETEGWLTQQQPNALK